MTTELIPLKGQGLWALRDILDSYALDWKILMSEYWDAPKKFLRRWPCNYARVGPKDAKVLLMERFMLERPIMSIFQ